MAWGNREKGIVHERDVGDVFSRKAAGIGMPRPVKTADARKGFKFSIPAAKLHAGTRQILFSQKNTICKVWGKETDMRKMIAMAVAGFVWRQLRTRFFARRQAARMARRGHF